MKISTVCHGNVARSQVLEHYLAEHARRARLRLDLFSCGTAPVDIYPRIVAMLAEVQEAMQRRGLPGTVTRNILDDEARTQLLASDLVLVADHDRLAEVLDCLGADRGDTDVRLFYDYIGEGLRDFVDTYDASTGAQDADRFAACFAELDRIAGRVIARLATG